MRARLAGGLAILLVLAVAAPLCVNVRPDIEWRGLGSLLGSQDQEITFEDTPDPRDAWPPNRLYSIRFDTQDETPDVRADRVAFLPMLNRSHWRVHETWLDAISETLGAYAAIVQQRQVVPPGLIAAILRKEGQPTWFALPNHFRYTDRVLDRVHRATGAGVIVWAEISEDGRIALDAKAMVPDADSSPWQGIVVQSTTSVDVHVFDAPRAVLARMIELERVPPPPNGTPDPEERRILEADLETARSEFWSGDPASLRRAERSLARLAAGHPGMRQAWLDLALVRAARPILFDPHAFHALMNEGPVVARHIARLFEDLDEKQEARLDFIDHLYTGHRQSSEEFDALIKSMPKGGVERALLAWIHEGEKASRFGVEEGRLPGPLGATLEKLVPLAGSELRRKAAAELAGSGDALTFSTPLVLMQARAYYDETDQWSREASAWILGSAFASTEGAEVLRDFCMSLNGESRIICERHVSAFVNEYAVEAAIDPTHLAAHETWEPALMALAYRTFQPRVPDAPAHPVPPSVLETPAELFPGLWYLSHQLIWTANQVFALADGAPRTIMDPSALLMGRPRDRIASAADNLLTAAYQPAIIGLQRGQASEFVPYYENLREISKQFDLPNSFAIRHRLDRKVGAKIPHPMALNSLGSRHPYRTSFLDDYVRQTHDEFNGSLAKWFGVLVPMPPPLEARVMRYRADLGEAREVVAHLESALARRSNVQLADTLEWSMGVAGRSATDRLAVLESVAHDFPYDRGLEERVAWVAVQAGHLEKAEQRFTALAERQTELLDACYGLGEVARRRGEIDVAEKILLSCVARSTNNWHRHHLLIRIANLRRDQDRFTEALAAVQDAYKEVKGSSSVLTGLAATYELMGELDESARWWRRDQEKYQSNGLWRSALSLARLELFRDHDEAAQAIFEELFADDDKHGPDLLALGQDLYAARGDHAGFRALCRRAGDRGLFPLARFEWQVANDPQTALSVLEDAEGVYPEWWRVPVLRAEILLATEDWKGALASALHAQSLTDNIEAARLITRSRIALGDLDPVREHVREVMKNGRWYVSNWETRARLEIAEGKIATARRTLDWATSGLHGAGSDGSIGWWKSIRSPLLLESELVGRIGTKEDDVRLEKRLFQAARRLRDDVDLWIALARVREHLGRAEEAQAAWNLVKRARPQHVALAERGHHVPPPARPSTQGSI